MRSLRTQASSRCSRPLAGRSSRRSSIARSTSSINCYNGAAGQGLPAAGKNAAVLTFMGGLLQQIGPGDARYLPALIRHNSQSSNRNPIRQRRRAPTAAPRLPAVGFGGETRRRPATTIWTRRRVRTGHLDRKGWDPIGGPAVDKIALPIDPVLLKPLRRKGAAGRWSWIFTGTALEATTRR